MAKRKIDMVLSIDTKGGRAAIKKAGDDIKAFSSMTVNKTAKVSKSFNKASKSAEDFSKSVSKSTPIMTKIGNAATKSMNSFGRSVDNAINKVKNLNKTTSKGFKTSAVVRGAGGEAVTGGGGAGVLGGAAGLVGIGAILTAQKQVAANNKRVSQTIGGSNSAMIEYNATIKVLQENLKRAIKFQEIQSKQMTIASGEVARIKGATEGYLKVMRKGEAVQSKHIQKTQELITAESRAKIIKDKHAKAIKKVKDIQAQLNVTTKKHSKNLSRLSKRTTLTTTKFSSLSKVLSKLKGKMKGAGSGAGGGAAGGFFASLKLPKTLIAMVLAAAAAYAYLIAKLVSFAKVSAMAAARYETLGVVLHVVSRNTGTLAQDSDKLVKSLEKTGISALQARQNLVRMMQANIDVAKATDLARIAQDAAVIGNIDSSQAFERLINGIQTAQVEVLRNIGITVSFERAYKDLADQLGKTSDSLTEQEKVQARVNAVVAAGKNIQGTYTAAMGTAAKKIGSLKRPLENLKIKFGEAFQPGLIKLVDFAAQALSDISNVVSDPAFQTGVTKLASGFADMAVAAGKAATHSVNFFGFLASLAGDDVDKLLEDQQKVINTYELSLKAAKKWKDAWGSWGSSTAVNIITKQLSEARQELNRLILLADKLQSVKHPLLTLMPDKIKKKGLTPDKPALSGEALLNNELDLREKILRLRGDDVKANILSLNKQRDAYKKTYGKEIPQIVTTWYALARQKILDDGLDKTKTAINAESMLYKRLEIEKQSILAGRAGTMAEFVNTQLEQAKELEDKLSLSRRMGALERLRIQKEGETKALEEENKWQALKFQLIKDGNTAIEAEEYLHQQRLIAIKEKTASELLSSRTTEGNRTKDIQESVLSDEAKLWQENWQGKREVVSKVLGDIGEVLAKGNKKQFELGKRFAIAQAVIDSIAGAQKAFTALAGIPIVGPALGFAAATTALAAGFARVHAIRSTQYDGQAHDGLSSVPKTGTFLLEEGERVVKKQDNKKLERALNGNTLGGGINNTFNIDATGADEGVEMRIRAGVEEAVARSYNVMMEDKIRGGPFSGR